MASGRQDSAAHCGPQIADELSPPIMQRFAAYLSRMSGMQFDASKTYLVENKLRALIRQNGLSSFSELIFKLESGSFPELSSGVVQAMTINETHFFRDRGPFQSLAAVLPGLARAIGQSRPLRIWSAACSTGQEIYSIAMTLEQEATKLGGLRTELVATDISAAVLAKAAAGDYSRFEVERGLTPEQIERFFRLVGADWRIDARLRQNVSFHRQNLLDEFVHLGIFDIIFCRNVLIYLNDETRRSILERMSRQLRPGGLLLLGSAETMFGYTCGFEQDYRAVGFLSLSPSRAPAVSNGREAATSQFWHTLKQT